MTNATAQLSNYRQSPRKVGLLIDAVRGKRVSDALAALDVMPKRAAAPIQKLIRSALANARVKGLSEDELVIAKALVGKGVVFKRSNPRARGSSAVIRKKASNVTIELAVRAKKPAAKKALPAAPAAEAATPEN